MFRVTHSALNVGLTLLVGTALPTLFVGLFAGVFVDRFNRQAVLLASDLLRGPHSLISIPIRLWPFDFGILGLYVVLFLPRRAGFEQFFDPAWRERPARRIAAEEELTAGQLVPVDQLVRLDGRRLRRSPDFLSSLDQTKIEIPVLRRRPDVLLLVRRPSSSCGSRAHAGVDGIDRCRRRRREPPSEGMRTLLWQLPLLRSPVHRRHPGVT